MPTPKVAIIGAGPAGITAGLALRKAGIEATVYERADEITPLGGAIILNAVGLTIMRRLGVDIEDIYNGSITEFRRYDGKVRATIQVSEQLLAEANATGWQSGMMRKELYARMLDAVPEGMIVPAHEFDRYEETKNGVKIHFKNGKVERADVLVGADGIRSSVRGQLFPKTPAPKPLGIAVWLGWCEANGIDVEKCVVQHDKNYQMGYCPLIFEGKHCYEWWLVEEYKGEDAPKDVPAYVKGLVGHFAEPTNQIMEQTDSTNQLFRWIVEYFPGLKRWSKGRITIMGDAAHPTSPYAAYGAGMAIEDGYFLGKYLKDADFSNPASIADALRKYEDLRRPYTNQTTRFARNLGRVYHNVPAPLRSIRDHFLDNVRSTGKNIEKGFTEEAEGLLGAVLAEPF